MDAALLNAAKHGDHDAYDVIARAVAPQLYRVAFRIMRNVEQAQDATQQALVALWRELPRLRDADRFDAWTYRLVVRACLTELRVQRRRPSLVRVRHDVDRLGDAGPVTADSAREVADRDELERAFRSLTEEQRVVVVLRHYVGLSNAEAAEAIGVPAGTAASRLHYAIQALRAALEANQRIPIREGQTA